HRIENSHGRRPVAHVDLAIPMSESPAFARIGESLPLPKIGQRPDKADLALPRKLNDPVVQDRDAFTEITRVDVGLQKDLPRFELHFSDGRPTVQPRAFIQEAAMKLQPLGESAAVVRKGADHSESVNGYNGRTLWRALREQGEPNEHR